MRISSNPGIMCMIRFLDDFEPGMKTAEVQEIFNALRPKQVELIKAISQAKKVDRSFLFLDYPEDRAACFWRDGHFKIWL